MLMVGAIASAGAAAGLAAGGYAYAAMWPTSQIFGHTIIAGRDPSELALTFDDGPNGLHTLRLLEILAKYDVRATFFVIGRFARQRPDIVKTLAAAGHLIGNHTLTHPLLVTRSPSVVRQELRDANAAIEDALGRRVEFFRPPHGGRRPDVLRAARELGLKTVLWNAMGYDWNAKSAEAIIRRVVTGVERNRHRGRGSNVLLHDGGQAGIGVDRSRTVAATEALLIRWKEAGLRFVTVDAWA
jgi:peptidoglycan/xylan/chitin deacetylase (PgdA/CDA1 family)